jgi:hypothetical protein
MDIRLSPDNENAHLEDALKSLPLVSMPRSISTDVLARIQKDIRPALFTWGDFVLSLVISVCMGALFFALQSLPPIIVAKLRIQGILLYQDNLIIARQLWPMLGIALGVLLAGFTVYQLSLLRRDL